MKCRLSVLFLFVFSQSFSQSQTCPVNINFSTGDLTHWYAYTGNNMQGGRGLVTDYDSGSYAPSGTRGNRSISEYRLASVPGIQVITANGRDAFGGFSTIPTINGYSYNYSILLGSTSITRGNGQQGSGGGYVRGVSYDIQVPPGSSTVPYTMTYAYAMVLENGTHVSSQQPVISATLRTPTGVFLCASPSYYLPTFNNVTENGRGATLDSAAAKKNGFRWSYQPSPNANVDPNNAVETNLQDVWTKAWTEVTFDLSAYRGQKVSLTFEADNCVPGGHFAYAYIAIRNSCAGLMISGDSLVCNNTVVTYSVPALDSAVYKWDIPASWTLVSSDTGNIIQVKASSLGGSISVREKNGCADLSDALPIKTLPSPEAGTVEGSATVCTGDNATTLNLTNYSGTITNWLSSTDNLNWTYIPNRTAQYTAENLTDTTFFSAVVVKGSVCPPDSANPATIAVDAKTIAGLVDPPNAVLCVGQTAGEILNLTGNNGSVQNWQSSTDGINWVNIPSDLTPKYTVRGITTNTAFRSLVKNGVCPADTSAIASVAFDSNPFPNVLTTPADTTICYGTSAELDAHFITGTSYTWSPVAAGNGMVAATPEDLFNKVSPAGTTEYYLVVLNTGCPNSLVDSFHVVVRPPVIVDAGRDTSIVIGEPLQFHARSSDPGPDVFYWTPATALSDPAIADPVGNYTAEDNLIKYSVTATTSIGCTGEATIAVKVFKTKPDIFVPNAFTPGRAINAVFRPVPVGITGLDYFRVYNRLGQLVFNTSSIGSGWDGNLNGSPQGAGGYVWMVKGTDYLGNVITKKGTMVLVR